jgi:hypothetical protein
VTLSVNAGTGLEFVDHKVQLTGGYLDGSAYGENWVTASMIEDGTITNDDIAAGAAIGPEKVAGTAWTSQNDGSGSTLDADKIDGLDSSDLAPAVHTHSSLDAPGGGPTGVVAVDAAGKVTITGTGDDAVTLPEDAISSVEILDEPGIAAKQDNVRRQPPYDPGSAPNWPVMSISELTITTPGAGYVFAIGTAEIFVRHQIGAFSIMDMGISEWPDQLQRGDEDMGLQIPPNAPTGDYVLPSSVHCIFEVTAGTHEFYLVAQSRSGYTELPFRLSDVRFTLLYLPQAYGSVDVDVTKQAHDDAHIPSPILPAGQHSSLFVADPVGERISRLEGRLEAIITELHALKTEVESPSE